MRKFLVVTDKVLAHLERVTAVLLLLAVAGEIDTGVRVLVAILRAARGGTL